jgi:hypothetical protein
VSKFENKHLGVPTKLIDYISDLHLKTTVPIKKSLETNFKVTPESTLEITY